MKALLEFLRRKAEGDLLPWAAQCEGAERFGKSLAEVEQLALSHDILPLRYRRNRETISLADQRTLFRSRVTIVGCGGLGGYLVEQLARLGVGTLVLLDPDCFEEHNLNRQLLSSPRDLGKAKVTVAQKRVEEINPAVTVIPHRIAFSRENASLLDGSEVVVDGLDNLLVRKELAEACAEKGIPLVLGAIAGWYGQLLVQLPGEDRTPWLGGSADGKGLERNVGNPSFTPAAIASLEVAEVVKILLDRPSSGKMLFLDLLSLSFEEIPL